MKVLNIHERELRANASEVGALVDSLASPDDRLWPSHLWPAMRFDRPLGVGAVGGHGPIRYVVDAYEKGRAVSFRFATPGFEGGHRFEVIPSTDGARLRHTVEMHAVGRGALEWRVAIRSLHDACVEDAFDKAERSLTGRVASPSRHSLWVRMLRGVYILADKLKAA